MLVFYGMTDPLAMNSDSEQGLNIIPSIFQPPERPYEEEDSQSSKDEFPEQEELDDSDEEQYLPAPSPPENPEDTSASLRYQSHLCSAVCAVYAAMCAACALLVCVLSCVQ